MKTPTDSEIKSLDSKYGEIKVQLHENEEVGVMIQEKLKKLYEEVAEKNRIINVLNVDINEKKSEKDKLNFEFKKEKDKNGDITK